MSDKTAIEWTDASWNPIRLRRASPGTGPDGHYCLKLSPGCDHCYASALQPRYFGGAAYPATTTATIAAARASVEAGGIYLDRRSLEQPLHWRRPRRIFVCSMTDLFGEWVRDEWLDRIWATMAAYPQHTWQVLTKRPNRLREYLHGGAAERIRAIVAPDGFPVGALDWPLENVWLGVTVESDAYAWRAKVLAEIPAAVRFVSAEPLLGPLPHLRLDCPVCEGGVLPWLDEEYGCEVCRGTGRAIDWLIVGGESGGPLERRLVVRCTSHLPVDSPPHPCLKCQGNGWAPKWETAAWVGDLRDRAQAAGVAFFFKQWGGATPKAGGRLLDGREYSEFPQVLANISEEKTS